MVSMELLLFHDNNPLFADNYAALISLPSRYR